MLYCIVVQYTQVLLSKLVVNLQFLLHYSRPCLNTGGGVEGAHYNTAPGTAPLYKLSSTSVQSTVPAVQTSGMQTRLPGCNLVQHSLR